VSAETAPRRVEWLLVLLLAAAGALRVFHLGTESLWLDEAISVTIANDSFARIVDEASKDVHPPFYYFLLRVWLFIATPTEAGARLLSVLLSLCLIGAAYALARRLAGRGAALVTAALLTVSPFHIQFAQEARMYVLLALTGTLSMHTFLEAFVLGTPRRGWMAGYVIVTALMLYTQIYSTFTIAAQGVSMLLLVASRRVSLKHAAIPWAASVAAAVLLYSPWVSVLVRQATRVQEGFWIPQLPWQNIFQPFHTYAGSIPLVILLSILAVLGAWRYRSLAGAIDHSSAPVIVLLAWTLCPIVLPFLLSRIGSPIFLPKYTIAASVPFAMLAACGTMALPRTGLRVALVVLVATLAAWPLSAYFTKPRKDGWRAAVAQMEALAQPGDLVVLHQGFNQWVYDYYSRRKDLEQLASPFGPAPPDESPGQPIATRLASAVGSHRRVWLFVLHYDPWRRPLASAFAQTFLEREHFQPNNMDVYLFERTSAPDAR